MHHPATQESFPPSAQARSPQHHPLDPPPLCGPNPDQHRGPHIATPHENLQRGDIVHNHRPADGGRTAGQVIVPDDEQHGEQLGAAADEEGGAERVGAREVRDEEAVEGEAGGGEGAQEADGEVEG